MIGEVPPRVNGGTSFEVVDRESTVRDSESKYPFVSMRSWLSSSEDVELLVANSELPNDMMKITSSREMEGWHHCSMYIEERLTKRLTADRTPDLQDFFDRFHWGLTDADNHAVAGNVMTRVGPTAYSLMK